MANLFKKVTMADAEMADIINAGGEGEEIIEEGAAEELEMVEVGEDLAEEQNDIEEYAEGARESGEDIEDLEVLEGELEAELANPEGEGVNETTLASHRTTLAILARRVGLDLGYTQNRITKQSLQASGVDCGREAARIVLAGIKDTIIAIWEKIKAALKMLWDKVVKFWNKHLSAVGRVQKALLSTRSKMKSLKGAPDYAKTHKAPASLIRMFPTAKTMEDSVLKTYIAAHNKAGTVAGEIQGESRRVAAESAKLLKSNTIASSMPFDKKKEYKIASEGEPLISGYYATVKFEEADDSTDESPKYKGEFEKETVEADKDEMDLTVATKSQMDSLLSGCIDLMKETVKFGKAIKDGDKQYQKDIKTISDAIGKKDGDKEQDSDVEKHLRATARAAGQAYQFYQTVAPQVTTKIGTLNVQLSRAVIAFCKTCASKYKKA